MKEICLICVLNERYLKKWMKQNMKIDANKLVFSVNFNHSRSKFQPNLAQGIHGFRDSNLP